MISRDTLREKAVFWSVRLRYILPVATGVLLAVLSPIYLIRYYQSGRGYLQSLWHFYTETLSAAHSYFGGPAKGGWNIFFGWLTAGAIVGILCYLAALAFSVWVLYTVFRAFGKNTPERDAKRLKLRLKILVPNPFCLFLTNCLYLPAVLFPTYYRLICSTFPYVAGEIFIERDIPLIVVCVLTVLMLVFAVFAAVWEKKIGQNPFEVGGIPNEGGEEQTDS